MNDQQVSKGIAALRRSNNKPQKITIDGETFYFRRMTIDQEDALDLIIRSHQDSTLREPASPPEGSDDSAWESYEQALAEYRVKANKAFRRLTADIMKFILTDENGGTIFLPEDDVYTLLDNVYASCFHRAYIAFRQGGEVSSAAVEQRFPK